MQIVSKSSLRGLSNQQTNGVKTLPSFHREPRDHPLKKIMLEIKKNDVKVLNGKDGESQKLTIANHFPIPTSTSTYRRHFGSEF
jgi:hypothetical protein